MPFPLFALLLACILAFIFTYARTNDYLHPVCLGAIFTGFLFPGSYITLGDGLALPEFSGLPFYKDFWYYFFGFLVYALGGISGSGATKFYRIRHNHLLEENADLARLIRNASFTLAATALALFAAQVISGGGFVEVYSRVKGRGDLGSGIQDLIYLSVTASVLYFYLTRGRPLKYRDVIILCFMLSPFLISGLLSSRRGAMAMGLGALFFGYCLVRGKRPNLLVFVGLVIFGGLFLMLLVTFRHDIYLGSNILSTITLDVAFERLIDFFSKPASSHELIYSSTIIDLVRQQGDYWGGYRYLIANTVWLVPGFVFPDKYNALNASGMLDNAGTLGREYDGLTHVLGSAPMLYADVYVEFGYFGLFFLFLIGFILSKLWRMTINGKEISGMLYPIAAVVLIFLFSQTFAAFSQRFIVMAGGLYIVLYFNKLKKRKKPLLRVSHHEIQRNQRLDKTK